MPFHLFSGGFYMQRYQSTIKLEKSSLAWRKAQLIERSVQARIAKGGSDEPPFWEKGPQFQFTSPYKSTANCIRVLKVRVFKIPKS